MGLKKQWYEVVAPKMFGGKVVGETPAVEPKSLIGRVLNVSMLEVSRDYSKFYIKLRFRIEKVDGQKAMTKFIGHDVMTERVYRMVQRYGRRVDIIEDVRTKDGVRLRVKVVFVLIKHVGTTMKDAARRAGRERLAEIAGGANFEDFVRMTLSGELASELRKSINKVYPLSGIEIRKSELLEEKKKVAVAA
jgi:small subunit ribosomal protein S3Ae